MMKRQRRQHEIVALLAEGHFRGIGDLAEALSVSEETIRRELRVLEASGAVVRAHGAVRLAKAAQAPLCPYAWSVRRRKVLNTWDRFVFPFPFSKGAIVWAEPIDPPRRQRQVVPLRCGRR